MVIIKQERYVFFLNTFPSGIHWQYKKKEENNTDGL